MALSVVAVSISLAGVPGHANQQPSIRASRSPRGRAPSSRGGVTGWHALTALRGGAASAARGTEGGAVDGARGEGGRRPISPAPPKKQNAGKRERLLAKRRKNVAPRSSFATVKPGMESRGWVRGAPQNPADVADSAAAAHPWTGAGRGGEGRGGARGGRAGRGGAGRGGAWRGEEKTGIADKLDLKNVRWGGRSAQARTPSCAFPSST